MCVCDWFRTARPKIPLLTVLCSGTMYDVRFSTSLHVLSCLEYFRIGRLVSVVDRKS